MILLPYNKAHVNYALITSVYFYPYVLSYFAPENFKVVVLVHSNNCTVTNYRRLGGLNCRHLFLKVLEDAKSKIKVPANSVSGKSMIAGLQEAVFSCVLMR